MEHHPQTIFPTVFDRFETPNDPTFVMWWVLAGHQPTPEKAMEKLAGLKSKGSSEQAFGWNFLPGIQLWKQQ